MIYCGYYKVVALFELYFCVSANISVLSILFNGCLGRLTLIKINDLYMEIMVAWPQDT